MPISLSKASSKASSSSSLHILGDEEVLTYNMPPMNSNSNNYNEEIDDQPLIDPDDQLMKCLNLTQRDPLGSLLLDIVKWNQELAKKTNTKESVMGIPDLCTRFANNIRLQRQRIDNKLQLSTELVQTNIINNELHSHRINQALEAPTKFSSVDVLTTPSKIADCAKLLPSRNHKFTGGKKDTDMSVVEFLTTMNNCQEKVNMSKKEFLEMLINSTTGAPFLQITLFKANNESISHIYHQLMNMYDKRPTTQGAKDTLHKYRAPRTATLADAESYIMNLANRIAMSLPIGESRTNIYNLEACQAIIRAMPPNSKNQIQTLYNTISAKLNRACTFSELSMALNVYRTTIDEDLAQNGHVEYKDRQNKNRDHKNVPRYNAHQVSSSYNFTKNKFQNKSMRKPNIEQNPRTTTYYIRDNRNPPSYNTRRIGTSSRTTSHFLGSKTNNKNIRNQQCSLCGQSSHRASACKNMRDDKGRVINIIPTHGTCSNCATSTRNLHHPMSLCPWREKFGYLAKKQQ